MVQYNVSSFHMREIEFRLRFLKKIPAWITVTSYMSERKIILGSMVVNSNQFEALTFNGDSLKLVSKLVALCNSTQNDQSD